VTDDRREQYRSVSLVHYVFAVTHSFILKFFEKFPYETRNVIKTWHGEVFLESLFKSTCKTDFCYDGKMYKAYIKLRVETLKVSMKYPQEDFGIQYSLGVKNGSS
jgi:hypothetical protein